MDPISEQKLTLQAALCRLLPSFPRRLGDLLSLSAQHARRDASLLHTSKLTESTHTHMRASSIRRNTQEQTQNQWEMREDSTPPFLRMQDNTQPTLNLPRSDSPARRTGRHPSNPVVDPANYSAAPGATRSCNKGPLDYNSYQQNSSLHPAGTSCLRDTGK